jgi:hypothetical protein
MDGILQNSDIDPAEMFLWRSSGVAALEKYA